MSIISNSIMTWGDLSSNVVNSIKSICCNIDSFAEGVPERLKSGQSQAAVKTVGNDKSIHRANPQRIVYETFTYYANPSNLISIVATPTVIAEWNNFIASAGITVSHTDKVIQAKELGDLIGLFMRFMAYHVKPINSDRKIYDPVDEAQSTFRGCKYVTGEVTPDYSVTAISPSNIPVPDNDIIHKDNGTGIIDRNFTANRLLTHYDNPQAFRSYLS